MNELEQLDQHDPRTEQLSGRRRTMTTRIDDRLDAYRVTTCLICGEVADHGHDHRAMLDIENGRNSARCLCGWEISGDIPEMVAAMRDHG